MNRETNRFGLWIGRACHHYALCKFGPNNAFLEYSPYSFQKQFLKMNSN